MGPDFTHSLCRLSRARVRGGGGGGDAFPSLHSPMPFVLVHVPGSHPPEMVSGSLWYKSLLVALALIPMPFPALVWCCLLSFSSLSYFLFCYYYYIWYHTQSDSELQNRILWKPNFGWLLCLTERLRIMPPLHGLQRPTFQNHGHIELWLLKPNKKDFILFLEMKHC